LKDCLASSYHNNNNSSSNNNNNNNNTTDDDDNNDDNNNNNNDNDGEPEFDFGNNEPFPGEKPDVHLGGIRQLVEQSVAKSVKPVMDAIAVIEESISKDGGVDYNKELEPLKKDVTDIHEKVEEELETELSKIKKSGDSLKKVADDLGDHVEDLGVVSEDDVKDLQKALEKDVNAVKEKSTEGINKLGKVAVSNEKHLEAIYNDIHQVIPTTTTTAPSEERRRRRRRR